MAAIASDLDVSADLVGRLLREQCPDLADLPVAPFTNGWDNESYRLGSELLVRLPRRHVAAELVLNEQQWLPLLSPHLTVDVPTPVFSGRPSRAFPYAWSIVPLLPGRPMNELAVEERTPYAPSLADFFIALHSLAPPDAPANPFRGVPLSSRRDVMLQRLITTPGFGAPAVDKWLDWSSAAVYDGPSRWLHGDPHPLNLLVDGTAEVTGALDWGDVCGGDPASDLATAWLTFDSAGRQEFRDLLDTTGRYDEDTWTRARAWALALAAFFVSASAPDSALAQVGSHAAVELLIEGKSAA